MSESTFFRLPRDQVAGAIVVNAFAILSAVALLAFALRIVWLAFRRLFNQDVEEPKEYTFFHTQLGYYAACMLMANMFNSIAGLLGLRTLADGGTFQDGYCRTQGFLMQFGNLSTAYFTTAIGLHTFNSLVLRKRQSPVVYTVAIILGWVIAGILAALPFFIAKPDGEIYGVSGMSCGIRSVYGKVQFLLHLLPIFFTASVSAILYALVFLVLRGTLVIRGGVKLQLNPDARWNLRLDGYHKFVAGIAKSMIWYPIAYICFLIPYSVTRLFALSGFQVPFQALVFAFTCWFLLGVVNVLLLYNTLRVLSPAFDSRNSAKDPESAGGREQRSYSQFQPHGVQEKTMYAFPTPFSPMSPTATDLSGYGSERQLLPYPERVASIASYYSYPTTDTPFIANNIASVSTLNQGIHAHPEPVGGSQKTSSPPESVIQHSRDNSVDSLISLPPPPRPARTPPLAREANAEIIRPTQTPSPKAEPISPFQDASSTSARVRKPSETSNSSGYSDLDITGWLAKHNADGSLAQGSRNGPPLSAVTPSSPSELSPNSARSASGPRPLLLSQNAISSPGEASSFRIGFI